MKRTMLLFFLSCEAILCLLAAFFREFIPGVFTSMMAFPFEQIALGLRSLSLSGQFGNAIAILLYAVFCLLPVTLLPIIRRKRRLVLEDALLPLLSLVLFAVVYLMINPGIIRTPASTVAVKAFLGTVAWSVIAKYFLLRVLRLFYTADVPRLQKYMAVLLYVLAALFVAIAFGVCFGDFLNTIGALRAGNTGSEDGLWVSYIFLGLQYLVNALPYVLDAWVVFAGIRLLTELQANRYSQAAVDAAQNLSQRCCKALIIIVATSVGFNLLQLAFVNSLRVISATVQVPIPSIAFLLAVLLLAQYIGENKQLKEDNDLIV